MTDVNQHRQTARWWVAAFLIATFGTGALKAGGLISGPISTVLFLASFLLIIPVSRASQRAMKERGTISTAMIRYNRRFVVASLAYIAFFFAGMWVARTMHPAVPVRVLLALIAAVPVIGMIRAMALLLKEETDEYLLSRHIGQSLFATGFLLTIATLYGFLNAFDVAPRVDAWAAFPLWAVGLGVGQLFQKNPSC